MRTEMKMMSQKWFSFARCCCSTLLALLLCAPIMPPWQQTLKIVTVHFNEKKNCDPLEHWWTYWDSFRKTHSKAEKKSSNYIQTIRLNHQFTEETNNLNIPAGCLKSIQFRECVCDLIQLFATNEIAVNSACMWLMNEWNRKRKKHNEQSLQFWWGDRNMEITQTSLRPWH